MRVLMIFAVIAVVAFNSCTHFTPLNRRGDTTNPGAAKKEQIDVWFQWGEYDKISAVCEECESLDHESRLACMKVLTELGELEEAVEVARISYPNDTEFALFAIGCALRGDVNFSEEAKMRLGRCEDGYLAFLICNNDLPSPEGNSSLARAIYSGRLKVLRDIRSGCDSSILDGDVKRLLRLSKEGYKKRVYSSRLPAPVDEVSAVDLRSVGLLLSVMPYISDPALGARFLF